MKHEITITIDPDDLSLEVEVNGVKGSLCEALSGWTDNLGKVTEHRRKPEYTENPIKVIPKQTIRQR